MLSPCFDQLSKLAPNKLAQWHKCQTIIVKWTTLCKNLAGWGAQKMGMHNTIYIIYYGRADWTSFLASTHRSPQYINSNTKHSSNITFLNKNYFIGLMQQNNLVPLFWISTLEGSTNRSAVQTTRSIDIEFHFQDKEPAWSVANILGILITAKNSISGATVVKGFILACWGFTTPKSMPSGI